MKNKTWTALMVAACIAGWPGRLMAQETDPKQLLEQAADLAREERFDEAIGIWLGVLDRLAGDDLATAGKKLGIAFQQTGRLPEAWHYLSRYLASPSGQGGESMAGWLQDVQTSLQQTHVKVTFSFDPSGLILHIPASKPGTASQSTFDTPLRSSSLEGQVRRSTFSWWFLPGKHELRAEAPGYQPRGVALDVRETGDRGVREIRLAAVEPLIPVEAVPDVELAKNGPDVIDKSAKPRSDILEWTLVGSGLALGVTGVIFHGLGYSRNGELDTEYSDASKHPYGPAAKTAYDAAYDDEVRPKKIVAYALYGVGGAALVSGIIIWAVRSPGGNPDGSAPLTLAPLTPPGGAGAMMTLEF